MKEDFLHYIWKFKKFDFSRAVTVEGLPVTLIDAGLANLNSGPDFFNSKLKIGEQLWAGNVEIHIKSSDWYAHGHENDPAYDNVILHVVWDDDVAIYKQDNTTIPTLELRELVPEITLQNYRNLLLAPNRKWINCETDFSAFENFELQNWMERLYLERLEEKSKLILELLRSSGNNWEAVLFKMLAKNFGLKVNGAAFLSLAASIPFGVLQKCRSSQFRLEALLFGQAGLLDPTSENIYFNELKKEYQFLKGKFGLSNSYVERPKYFRLRPDNFPTIRLSQLATLYYKLPHVFSTLIATNTVEKFKEILIIETSDFWKEHYSFEKSHSSKTKKLTSAFIDLLIINTIIPLKFCYNRSTGSGDDEELLSLMENLNVEKNSVIEKFNKIRSGTAVSALHSQALLQLKSNYCDKNACLNCNLGSKLLKGNL
ncbi:DUF2851 family protein [Antarcticibacterium sp. 1MA-6-2]|uniref:DUF2851 family protein n=1 Tax=Antarcticibacterium sp. 1MA-6-2 TaxID=2908210 RepID=UPI001F45BF78|nr:DUF2851 family protein [Antarcticibacterium sp. 1MA-6-2]UJH92432.1 DUF2851 family protein [Antarcticibacterium sp. 1MA-6-2]